MGSALIAEAIEVKQALRAAAVMGLSNLNLFSDSLVIGSDLNEIAGFLCDIWNLVSLFNHLSFFHVSRTSNVLVDSSKISSGKS